jgi:Bleomycin resistance protein-like N-terminal
MSRKIFVNLPVKDLKHSMSFFEEIGFQFNPQFTDDTTACMVITDDNYAMLLTHTKFKAFTKKEIANQVHRGADRSVVREQGEGRRSSRESYQRGQSNPLNFRTMGSCTAGASTTSTVILGRSSGWTRTMSRRPEGKLRSNHKMRRSYGPI